jgi:hypothetical protein
MGKRSNFERVPRDFYPTPYAAVPPLIPHLRGIRTFAEPCCGNGALVHHLELHGLRCGYAGDISTGQDALALEQYGDADAIILMHRANARDKEPAQCDLFRRRSLQDVKLNYMPNDLDVSSVDMARAEEIIGLGGEMCAKSSASPITADCAPRRSFYRTLDRILRNAGFKGDGDGPRTV